MRKILSTFILMLFALTATVFAEANFETSEVTAEGYGTPPAGYTDARGYLLARRAAIVDAQRVLAECIAGVQVDAETTVENMAVANDTVKTRVSALVKNARVVNEKMEAGAYHVTLAMPMYGARASLASAVLPKVDNPVPFATPTPQQPAITPPPVDERPTTTVTTTVTITPTSMSTGNFTGLVVDCSGLELRPAMSPVIYDDNGTPIYGHRNLDSKKVISKGMASYTTADTANFARAGANPLVVRAVAVDRMANPVIAAADAQRILAANNATHFLDDCAVVFVR